MEEYQLFPNFYAHYLPNWSQQVQWKHSITIVQENTQIKQEASKFHVFLVNLVHITHMNKLTKTNKINRIQYTFLSVSKSGFLLNLYVLKHFKHHSTSKTRKTKLRGKMICY